MKILPLTLLLFLISCKTITIVQPELSLANPVFTEVPKSVIHIPIEIDLKSNLKEVEKALPKTFEGNQEQCEGVSFAYKFIREPIDFQYKNTSLYYEVDGKFELKLNYCPSCHELWDKNGSCSIPRLYASCGSGEPMRRVKIAYASTVEITDSYQFNAQTELKKFEILDPCKITLFKYDATTQVEKEIRTQLESLEKDIDQQIEAIDLRSSMKDVWKQLEDPMDLSGYGLLYLNPINISLSPVLFDPVHKKATLNALLTLSPLISTNKEQQEFTVLPKQSSYHLHNGFELHVPVIASYDSINKQMNKSLTGYKIPFNKKVIILDSLHIIGNKNGQLLVEVHFSGTKNGVFYLTGKPIITPEQSLVLTDIDYDVNSKSVLLKTAKWMFDKRILEELSKAAKYDLNPLLIETKKSIEEQLNSTLTAGVFLNGRVNRLVVSNMVVGIDHFYLLTEVSGNMKLKME